MMTIGFSFLSPLCGFFLHPFCPDYIYFAGRLCVSPPFAACLGTPAGSQCRVADCAWPSLV